MQLTRTSHWHRPFWRLAVATISLLVLPAHISHAQTSNNALNVAIIPHRSNLGNEQAYRKLFDELKRKTGISFKWVGSRTYDDVIEKLGSAAADIAYVGPFAYVDARDRFDVRLICRTLSRKQVEYYHSMIISRRDSGLDSLADLKGRTFSFTDRKSTSGYLFPMAQLMNSGIELKDFSEVRFLIRHANSLMAVYRGHVDAGATSFTAIDKVDIDFEQIKILWKSAPIYRGPWVARKALPDEQFLKVQQAMLQISRSDDANEIFANLTTKGFVAGRDSDYDNVRDVIRLMKSKE